MQLKKTYKKIRNRLKFGCEIETFEHLQVGSIIKSENNSYRINLVVSTIDKNIMYGGLSTAFNFFFALVEGLGFDARIIVTDKRVTQESAIEYKGYVTSSGNDSDKQKKQIVDYTFLYNKRPSLCIRQNDIFLATYWTTMHLAQKFRIFQENHYGVCNPIIYLIQDYEPGFYNWSSNYLLAESTYKVKNTIAVFNSLNLYNYMDFMNYSFLRSYYFEPKLNNKLKQELMRYLDDERKLNRKKQLIIYGRPFIGRNCFSLIIAALQLLVKDFPAARDWDFLSLGSNHKTIPLGYGVTLKCKGKLSLEQYAKTLLESKVGVSLMCSPHPSYPPLEMASFGVNTVTNSYMCKNLSSFAPQIVSIDEISIESLTEAIWKLMNTENKQITIESNYFDADDQFNSVVTDLKKVIKNH